MLIKILRRQRVVRWTKQYQLCNAKKKQCLNDINRSKCQSEGAALARKICPIDV